MDEHGMYGAVGSTSDCNCSVVPLKAPVISLSKKLNSHCLVLVSSRNWFERDFTIEL